MTTVKQIRWTEKTNIWHKPNLKTSYVLVLDTKVYLQTILSGFYIQSLLFYPFKNNNSAVNMHAIFYIKVLLKLSCFKKANAIQSSNKQMIKQLASIVKTN